MASNNIARLGVVLGLDSAEFEKGVDEAIAANRKLKDAIRRESNAAAKEITALKYATDDYGKSVTQVERLQREFITGGKYARATDELKQKLLEQAAAYDKKVASEKQAFMSGSKLFQMTTQQRAALAYQTTDIITGLASGQNPMIVLIQQGGQLRDQFGGFIPLFKGIAQAFTLTRVAIGGLAAAFAAVGFAAYSGVTEVEKFNKTIVLTGNYAGITFDRFKLLSSELSDRFNLSVSQSRDIFSALIQSGKFVEPTMTSIANVIARVAKLTGESADAIAKDLIPAFDGSAASAARLNERYNFLTQVQYRQIELLAAQGKTQEAAKLTADLLSQSLERQKVEVHLLTQTFTNLKNAIVDTWKAFSDLFMPETNIQMMQRFAKEAENLIKKFGADPNEKQKGQIGGKILEYLGAYRLVLEEQERVNKEAAEKQKEREKIENDIRSGGLQRRRQLDAEYAKISNDVAFQAAVYRATEIERIYLESNKRAADAVAEFDKANIEENNNNRIQRARILAKQIEGINAEAAQKVAELSRKEFTRIFEEQQTKLDTLRIDREQLQIYRDNLFLTESQAEVLVSRLRTEQEIAKILRDQKMTEEDKAKLIDRAQSIQQQREELLKIRDDLKIARDMTQSVFSNMEQALTNFVRTGKLSFKDLARSIIQDMLLIQMRAQMLSMFKGLGSIFNTGGSFYTDASGMFQQGMAFAEGGEPPVGVPSLVGERGPELFVPRSAGTIIPNHKLNDTLGGQTSITNNYINAIDVKSFEDRLMNSSNAVWAANRYADKSLAVSRGRT